MFRDMSVKQNDDIEQDDESDDNESDVTVVANLNAAAAATSSEDGGSAGAPKSVMDTEPENINLDDVRQDQAVDPNNDDTTQQESVHSDAGATASIDPHYKATPANHNKSATTSSTEQLPELFTDLPDIDDWQDIFPASPTHSMAGKSSRRSCPRRRVSAGITLRRHSVRRDSLQTVRIKQLIEGLEGVVTGLQGGVLQLIESVHNYKQDTEQLIAKQTKSLMDKLQTINTRVTSIDLTSPEKDVAEKINNLSRKMTDMNQCGNDIQKKYSHFSQDLANVADKLKGLNRKVTDLNSCSSDINKKHENIPKDLADIRYAIDGVAQKIDNSTKKTAESLAVIDEKITTQPEMTRQHDSGTRRNQVSEASTNSQRPLAGTNTVTSVRPKTTATNSDTEYQHKRDADHRLQERRVLLIGDSTTRLLDKRQVLKEETISKCRAGTIHEAYTKISTGGSHKMSKIVYCVGLNDLRDGKSLHQIENDMKDLVDETVYRHPGSSIYICSILPVKCSQINSSQITSVNKQLRSLEGYNTCVHFIDSHSEFLNYDGLFEQDGVHPNTRGAAVMVRMIRKKLQYQRPQPQSWNRRLANPTQMSYAECVSSTVKETSGQANAPSEATKPDKPPYTYPNRYPAWPGPMPGPTYPQAPPRGIPWFPYGIQDLMKFGYPYPF